MQANNTAQIQASMLYDPAADKWLVTLMNEENARTSLSVEGYGGRLMGKIVCNEETFANALLVGPNAVEALKEQAKVFRTRYHEMALQYHGNTDGIIAILTPEGT